MNESQSCLLGLSIIDGVLHKVLAGHLPEGPASKSASASVLLLLFGGGEKTDSDSSLSLSLHIFRLEVSCRLFSVVSDLRFRIHL